MASIFHKLGKGKHSWEPERWVVVNDIGKSFIRTVHTNLSLPHHEGRSIILFGDRPFAAMDQVCPTCSGTLYSGYADKSLIEKWLLDIRKDTQDINSINDNNISHFFPILELFEPGLYYVGLIDHKTTDNNLGFFMNLFGKKTDPHGLPWRNGPYGPLYLYPTQSSKKLDEKQVSRYIEQINQGKRPFGIAYYYDGFLSFLLDGHHKAKAYNQLGIDMPCLTFQRKIPYCDDKGIFYDFGNDINVSIDEIPKEVASIDRLWYEYSYREKSLENEVSIDYCKKLKIKTPLQELGMTPIQAINKAMKGKRENKELIDLFHFGVQELTDKDYAIKIGDELFKEKWGKWQALRLYRMAGYKEGIRRYADSLSGYGDELEKAYEIYLESGLMEKEMSKRSLIMAKYIQIRKKVLQQIKEEFTRGKISDLESQLKEKATMEKFLDIYPKVLNMKDRNWAF